MKLRKPVLLAAIVALLLPVGAQAGNLTVVSPGYGPSTSAACPTGCKLSVNFTADTVKAFVESEHPEDETVYRVQFRIDANKEQVAIQIEATPLWKGDDPFNNEVAPIELCDSSAVEIDPEYANPIQGGDQFPSPIEGGSIINGSRSQRFEAIIFESSQNGHFSQDVDVTVCWDQRDPELPTGEYSGWVKLTAMLIPY